MTPAGWSSPKIAEHLGRHPHTIRSALKGFAARNTAAFYPDALGPDPDHDRRAAVTGKLSELLGQERTWTARQFADALGSDIGIGHRQTRRYLVLLKTGYRRTAQTVGQKPRPEQGRAGTPPLRRIEKKVAPGRLQLLYLDASGFSPPLPNG